MKEEIRIPPTSDVIYKEPSKNDRRDQWIAVLVIFWLLPVFIILLAMNGDCK